MKKQHIRLTAALLLMVLLLGLPPTALAAERVSAKGGSIDITFNGTAMKLGAYNIANSNYVKLRDVAQLLKDTAKEFSVTWNGGAQRIDLASGTSYITEGGELGALASGERSAAPSAASVWLDGVSIALDAYTIDGSNFFKLRDLGAALDFCVDWDSSSVIVDTSRGYSQGASSAPPAAPSAGGAAAYSDEQLLALAQEAVEDMFEMSFRLDCYGILDFSWDETISAVPPGGSSEYPWTYYRAPGYTTAAQARAAMEQEWYRHFSRRYTIEQVMGENSNFTNPYMPYFAELNGALYMPECQWGGVVLSITAEQIVSRTADEVVFRGYGVDRDFPDDIYKEPVEFSLVFEDGVWKYGYYKNI